MVRAVDLSIYDLEEFDGQCMEVVDDLLHKFHDGEILWVDNPCPKWTYHASFVLDGIVHDPWFPSFRLPPAAFVAAAFGHGVIWEMNPGADM